MKTGVVLAVQAYTRRQFYGRLHGLVLISFVRCKGYGDCRLSYCKPVYIYTNREDTIFVYSEEDVYVSIILKEHRIGYELL